MKLTIASKLLALIMIVGCSSAMSDKEKLAMQIENTAFDGTILSSAETRDLYNQDLLRKAEEANLRMMADKKWQQYQTDSADLAYRRQIESSVSNNKLMADQVRSGMSYAQARQWLDSLINYSNQEAATQAQAIADSINALYK